MALSLRGWGPESFARATPEFLAAARWGLFLEAVTPSWKRANQSVAEPLPTDPVMKIPAAKVKQSALDFIAAWRPVLFPEDDGGE